MSDTEKKIAEIREKHSTGHYNYNYEIRDAIQFLLDELERVNRERDKLIEGLHNYMKELDRRYQKAYRNYDIDCDHHQLGMAEAYEVAESRLRDILREIGVTVE